MKKLSLLLILCVCSVHGFTQIPAFRWAHSFGGPVNDEALALTADSSGNVISTGYYTGTVDFDPGPGSSIMTSQNKDIFIRKTDPQGNFSWVRRIGNTGDNIATQISCDTSGNIYVAGSFTGTLDFDPGAGVFNMTAAGTFGATDIFIVKLDPAGIFIWAKRIGGQQANDCRGMVITPDNSICITGQFGDSTDFDPGAGTHYEYCQIFYDAFVLKLTSAGNFVWVKTFTGPHGWEEATSLSTDISSNLYCITNLNDSVDYDPGPGTAWLNGTGGSVIVKLNASGNYVWAKYFENLSTSQYPHAISADNNQRVYVAFNYSDTADADPGSGTHFLYPTGWSTDAVLLGLNNGGDLDFAIPLFSYGDEYARTVECDADGNVYFGGYFSDTVDFDGGPASEIAISSGYTDMFLAKYTGTGQLIWARTAGFTDDESLLDMAVTRNNGIVCSGHFESTVDLDPGSATYNLTSLTNYYDTFIFKWGECHPDSTTLNLVACDTLFVNNQYYTQSGTYVQHLQTALGCDSTLTIHATVFGWQIHYTSDSTCNSSYTWNNQTYTFSGQQCQVLTNIYGCDSIVCMMIYIGADTNVYTSTLTLYGTYSPTATYQWLDCDNNVAPIAGAVTDQYTPSVSGHYALEVTDHGCTDTSSCHELLITGNQNLFDAPSFSVYPNPSNDGMVNIDFGGAVESEVSVRVLNTLGQEVQNNTYSNVSKVQLNLPAASEGFYLIEVTTPTGTTVRRVAVGRE